MRATLIALVWSTLPLTVLAAAANPDKDSSSYDIEVLVFENRLPELVGDELLAKDAATLRRRALDEAVPPERPGSAPYLRPAVASQLEKDGRYRVLAYGHWQQTLEANPKVAVKPIRIVAANPAAPDELEGAVRLSLNKFLHLDVQMLYRDAAAGGTTPLVYQINEQRRVKSQETHYFDHPRFGVLVRLMPVEKEQKP
jgi:hypothetical protein